MFLCASARRPTVRREGLARHEASYGRSVYLACVTEVSFSKLCTTRMFQLVLVLKKREKKKPGP